MQDEVNERTVALSISGGRMSAEAMAGAMRAYLDHRSRSKTARQPSEPQGLTTMRKLSRSGAQLEAATLEQGHVAGFAHIAARYQVGYSLMRDRTSDDGRWIIFFKAKDAAGIEAAFKDYSAKVLEGRNRETVAQRLERCTRESKERQRKAMAERQQPQQTRKAPDAPSHARQRRSEREGGR